MGAASEAGAAFARLDAALDAGWSIAGYLTYELGAAWNGAPARPGTGPLACVGIYDGSRLEEPAPSARGRAPLEPAVAELSRAAYARALETIARDLRDGQAYQVNYTAPFRSRCTAEPRALFEALAAAARVRYGALVETEALAVLSLSPELFLAIDGDVVRTRPMKGTAEPDDLASLGTAKNRAEHVMIVDLLRSDLYRVCSEVRVEAFETVERYPTFATMTSTIAGRLRAKVGLEELFAATFPCGSVTGAPKRSAMRRIHDLEPTPRGVAMGSIGYLEPRADGGRSGWWNVAIRTLAIDRASATAELRVGGGIVADSTPATEWREIGLKRRLFRELEAPVGLIETIRAGGGRVRRLERHLARLAESAWRLGIELDVDDVRARVFAKADAVRTPALLRVRLLADGGASVDARPFEATPAAPRVCIVPQRLDASDPLLRHKTDRRATYDAALAFARALDCFDGVLLNAEGAVADGAQTSFFLREPDGRLATPRLDDGALPGLARGSLLTRGGARERQIAAEEVRPGAEVWLGSAARGLVRATVV